MPLNTHSFPYDEVHLRNWSVEGADIPYFSKPGLPVWKESLIISQLFAKFVRFNLGMKVLLIGGSEGPLSIFLALKNGSCHFVIADWNWEALNVAKKTINKHGISNITLHPLTEFPVNWENAFDSILITKPKSRKLMQRWLRLAESSLIKGGQLYLCGPNNQGIQSSIKDAANIFGEPVILGYRKGCRIARWIKQLPLATYPDWFFEPGIAPDTFREIKYDIHNCVITLKTLPGIFSFDEVDQGTALLLSHLAIKPGSTVLDLGCGYGLIGIYSALLGAEFVDLVDVNLMAVFTTGINIQLLDVKNAAAFPSDALSAVNQRRYNLVLTNPPFHSGREIDYTITAEFIRGSKEALLPGGELILVANKFLPYHKLLEAQFDQISTLAETNQYQLLSGKVR